MKKQFSLFLVRWLLNSAGLGLTVWLLGSGINEETIMRNLWAFLLAGLIFSVANALLRPFLIVISMPAILLTLGLFTLIVNGFLVYLSLALTPGLEMGFWNSVLAGIILSLVNYIVSSVLGIGRSTNS